MPETPADPAMPLPRRFDDTLMQAPADRREVDAALHTALQAWCEGGAWPVMDEPLRAASIAPHDGLDAVACALDGSHALARLGRWRGLGWRLRLLRPGRGARRDDPWDAGWWRAGPLEHAAAFRPRRATLLMVRPHDAASAEALLSALRPHAPAYARPLRVLVVSTSPLPGLVRL